MGKVGANVRANAAHSLCLHFPLSQLFTFHCYFTFKQLLMSKTTYTPKSFYSIFKRKKFTNLFKPVATDAKVCIKYHSIKVLVGKTFQKGLF